MNFDLVQTAIDQALSGNWKEAIKTNLKLLKTSAKDTDTLNRLARAYLETGQKTKATEIYQKVLRLDKFNTIAHKGLETVKNYRVDRSVKGPALVTNSMFLEEPGVTKTVTLIRPGDSNIISRLRPGEEVKIVCREHNVVVVSPAGQYLGRFSDDLTSRMRMFIKGGNTYSAWIRNLEGHTTIRVFIKETYRSPHFADIPSFPLTEKLSYAAFTPPELVHEEKPDVSATEWQEEENNPTKEETEVEGEQ